MREIRVASIQPLNQPHLSPFEGETDREECRKRIEANLDMACRLLSQAAATGCDVACYPEDVQGIAHYGYYLDDPELFSGLVESLPGPATEQIAEVARRHRTNVVFGIYERCGGEIYNACVLMGRRGEIVGKYRKVHLPAVERWGVAAGDSFPVFEADFGLVGMLVCYDIMFPEAARALALDGAEIIFNPTMGYAWPDQCEDNGELRVRARALDSMAPVVVSMCGGGTMIVDGRGNVVARADPDREEVIYASLDLDSTPMDRSQWEVLTGTADLRARYLQERRPEAYRDLISPDPPALGRCRGDGKRLISTEAEIRAAYEGIRRRWSPAA